MKRDFLPISAVLFASFMALPIAAHADPAEPTPPDTVTLHLSVEDWVQTETARVVIEIDAALPGADAGKIRTDMQASVAKLAPGAEWRFSSFNRSQEQSGLESWHAELEARLKETDLGGIADRAKQGSKPGLQLRLQQTDFTPTLAETEAVKTKLRDRIYAEVNDELKRLNAVEPGRNFRLGQIAFEQQDGIVRPMPMMRHAMMAAAMAPAAPAGDAAPVSVGEKITLEAQVELAAAPPKDAVTP